MSRALAVIAAVEALFLPGTGECLAVEEAPDEDLSALAMRLLTGSAKIDPQDVEAIRAINSWLLPAEVSEFLAAFNLDAKPQTLLGGPIFANAFSLPGRPALEKFFREYILEPSADRERYEALGVKVPNVLLHGPTGSGKSFAVSKLVKALGWPVFEVDLATVGSSFIHQTSISLRSTFEQAKSKAPAVVVLEEIDSLALSRGPMMHDHKVEEITELLRSIEKATENRILVIATTNRLEALDSAIRRKGRFDHEIEVGYPTAVEVRSAIEAMLEPRPHDDIQCLEPLSAALAGRPMSDVAWLVNEAARLAARAGKRSIGEADLMAASSAIG